MTFKLLSYMIDQKTPLYGNIPRPTVIPHSSISKGDTSNTFLLTIHNHSGTHVDAPNHFIESGRRISDYSLDELIFTKPFIWNFPLDEAHLIQTEDIVALSQYLGNVDFLLIHTGFGKFRNEDRYRTNNPGIYPETILWLRKNFPNIRCVGIDSLSISSFQHREIGRKAHRAAFIEEDDLGEPILLIEDMKLDEIWNKKVRRIIVLPWLVDGLESTPCNVLAEVI